MITLNLILLILAFVCLLLGAFGVASQRVQLGWLGMACGVLALLLGR
jgi:hypothetical protein